MSTLADEFWGRGNGPGDYLILLGFYAALALVMRHAYPRLELNFRRTFGILFFGWGLGTFIANWVLYKVGVMSFLPWANNFVHTFVWIGLCLGFLYAASYHKPLWEQFALFAIFSFLVKWTEREILGTWELDHFFWIGGNLAYIIGWSLMDGLYPVVSALGLRVVAKYADGVILPPVFRLS